MKKSILFFVVATICLSGGLCANPEDGMESMVRLKPQSPVERLKAEENQSSQALTALKNEGFLRSTFLWRDFLRNNLITKDEYEKICKIRKTTEFETLQEIYSAAASDNVNLLQEILITSLERKQAD